MIGLLFAICVHTELDTALDAAHVAGKSLLASRKEAQAEYQKEKKVPDSTIADKTSNELIYKTVHAAFPEDGYISQDGPKSEKALRYWLVDPLDGTSPYCKTNEGGFCVIITLIEKDLPVLNVTYFPQEDVTYYAKKGEGAFKQVGSLPAEKLNVTPSDTITPFASTETPLIASINQKLGLKKFVKSVSCGQRFCLLADKNPPANLYLTGCRKYSDEKERVAFTRTWDIGGTLILEEAGGIVTLLNPKDKIDWTSPEGFVYPQDHDNVLIATNNSKILNQIR